MLQSHERLWSLRDSVLMSCLGNEARQGAGMAAEKICGVSRGGGSWEATQEFLAPTCAALPEPRAGGQGGGTHPRGIQMHSIGMGVQTATHTAKLLRYCVPRCRLLTWQVSQTE